MFTIKQPSKIIFGLNSAKIYDFPQNYCIITSKGAKNRGWLEHTRLNDKMIFEKVESNPSLETFETIISEYKNKKFNYIVMQIINLFHYLARAGHTS